MSFHDRLNQKMKEKNLKPAQIARATKKSAVAAGKWVHGESIPKAETLKLLADFLDVSDEWLLHGKDKKTFNFKMQEFMDKHGLAVKEKDSFDESEVIGAYVYDGGESKLFAPVDVVDVQFSCGTGEAVEFHYDTVVDSIPIPYSIFRKKGVHPENTKVIAAKGDSMSEKIDDGDYVAIDITQTEIFDGEIYAVYFAGEGMIKQLFKEGDGSIVLHSLNPKYKDKIINEENGTNFRVMGKYFYRAG